MQEDNLPDAGTVDAPLTFDQQVERIGTLMAPDDPATPDPADPEVEAEADAGPEVTDDPVTDEPAAEDVDQEDAEDPDGSDEPEIKGGRFAPDTAKVTLDDGTVISVADLKRNNLFQRDYTRKTQELAAEREQVTSRKTEVDQQAQSLGQLSQYLNWYAEHYLPGPPQPPTDPNDPIAELNYSREFRAWQQQQGLRDYFNTELAKLEDGKKQETEAQKRQRLQTEARTLVEKDKSFADPVRFKAFYTEAVTKGGEYWGLTEGDLAGIEGHKQWLVLRDALAYRRLQAKAPNAVEQVKAKPKMVTGNNRRVDPGQKQNGERRVLSERLRKSGSMDDAVSLLSKFNL